MSNLEKTVDYYMSLPYEKTIKKVPESEGDGYIVTVPLLGTSSTYAWGETESEALDAIREVMQGNFESWLAGGYPIPEPEVDDKQYSGKILLRTTSNAHKYLAAMADEQGISVNQLLNNIVHEKIGMEKECATQVVEHHHTYRIPEAMVRSESFEDYRSFNSYVCEEEIYQRVS